MFLSTLLYSFIAITAINCLYYIIFSKFSFSKHSTAKEANQTPVSVIVYSKNEAALLPEFLSQFKDQTHTNYEIVLVNNASSDDTRYIFEAFQKDNQNVQIVNVENNEAFWGSRKYALTLGIKKATYENLLFTTTSAIFSSKDWIAKSSSFLNTDKQIFVGYSFFEKKGGFVNTFIRFSEIVSHLFNYGVGVITKPYHASQANFGYIKSLFFENRGFSDHMSIKEGSEDLFLKFNATSKNVVISTSKDNAVQKKSPASFSEWLQYKANQKYISRYYSFSNKLNLKLFGISQFLFFVLAIVSVILIPSILVFCVIVLRYFIAGLVLLKTSFKLRDLKPMYFFPFLEILHSFVQIPIFIYNQSTK